MADKKEEKKDDEDKQPDKKPDIDLNAIGKAFVEHYYTLFDNNRLQLADLYVMFNYFICILYHGYN